MVKKITVTLSEDAYEYFCEVAYSLDKGDGKVATQSEIINHCLLELYAFETLVGESVSGYISEKWPDEYKKIISKLHTT